MKYKVSVLMLAAVMAFGLSACGSKTDSPAGEETTVVEETTEETVEDATTAGGESGSEEGGKVSVNLPDDEWQSSGGSSAENGVSTYTMPVDSGKVIMNTHEFSGTAGVSLWNSIITDKSEYSEKLSGRAGDELLEFEGGMEENGAKYCFTVIKHTDPETFEVQYTVSDTHINENGNGYTAQATITGEENKDKLNEVKEAVKSVNYK